MDLLLDLLDQIGQVPDSMIALSSRVLDTSMHIISTGTQQLDRHIIHEVCSCSHTLFLYSIVCCAVCLYSAIGKGQN